MTNTGKYVHNVDTVGAVYQKYNASRYLNCGLNLKCSYLLGQIPSGGLGGEGQACSDRMSGGQGCQCFMVYSGN